jgi:hypothetical protein
MSAQPARAVPAITDDERTRRREAIRQAEANNRLEGLEPDPEAAPIFAAFVDGAFDTTEMMRRIHALHAAKIRRAAV